MDINDMYNAFYIGFTTLGITLVEVLAVVAAARFVLNLLEDSTKT